MTKGLYNISHNKKIAKDIYEMKLTGDTSSLSRPGQFINILIDGFYLRRPISVCDYDKNSITIIYKTVGEGTEYLSTLKENSGLDILVGLGNGFDTKKSGGSPLLIGGGVGVPPLYMLAKRLIDEGKSVKVIIGFNSKEEVFYEKEFNALKAKTFVTTADGSYKTRGFVTDALHLVGTYSYFYTCGPKPMLKAVYNSCETEGQFSFEERMGCGFGACMGCSCKTKYGDKRICKEGPVLQKEEIIW